MKLFLIALSTFIFFAGSAQVNSLPVQLSFSSDRFYSLDYKEILLRVQISNLKENSAIDSFQTLIHKEYNNIINCIDYFGSLEYYNTDSQRLNLAIKNRLTELAYIYIKLGLPIILTSGTNGDGGPGGWGLDKKTMGDGFIYASVSSSCIQFEIEYGMESFNKVTYDYLGKACVKKWNRRIHKIARRNRWQ